MNVTIEVKLREGKSQKIDFPNFSKNRFLIPKSLEVSEVHKNGERNENVAAKDCTVSVQNGLFVFQPPFFQLTNNIDLNEFRWRLADGNEFSVILTNNNSSEQRIFLLNLTYERSHGNIIYQNTYTEFGTNVTNDVYSVGHCTRLILSFNRAVKGAELVPIVDNLQRNESDQDWFDTLELGDTEDNAYVIDFTNEGFEIYPNYLNYMRLYIPKENETAVEGDDEDDEEEDDLKLYVIAYGYPKSSH